MGNRLSTASSNFYVRIAVLILLTVAAFAQVESGRFVGRITDSQGAVIAQANVSVKNVGTNITQTAVTDSDGNYVITPVMAGAFVMTVSAPGFSTSTTSNIMLQVGQTAREDLQLKVGSTSTTIQVTADVPLLSTDTATIGTVVTNRQLTDLPLNGRGFFRLAERNVFSVAAVTAQSRRTCLFQPGLPEPLLRNVILPSRPSVILRPES